VILIDTGPLVALCDGRDAKHRSAVSQLAGFTSPTLVLCEPVLTEACFLLPHPSQRRRLGGLLSALRVKPVSDTGDPRFWAAVFAWLARYDDHEPDWADAYLAVLSQSHPRATVWTFDREFRSTWRRPDGSPIPLANRI